MSAFECFQAAARCVQKAKDAPTDTDRKFLLDAAEHWKTLGNEAAKVEASSAFPAGRPAS